MAARKKARKSTHSRRPARSPKRAAPRKKTSRGRRWSARVTRTSHAMDTQQGVFKSRDPDKIVGSLLRSAKRSHTRKTTPFQSAMSLLNFYENRGGKNLSSSRRKVLDRAKDSLREQAGRDRKPPAKAHAGRRKRRTQARRRRARS